MSAPGADVPTAKRENRDFQKIVRLDSEVGRFREHGSGFGIGTRPDQIGILFQKTADGIECAARTGSEQIHVIPVETDCEPVRLFEFRQILREFLFRGVPPDEEADFPPWRCRFGNRDFPAGDSPSRREFIAAERSACGASPEPRISDSGIEFLRGSEYFQRRRRRRESKSGPSISTTCGRSSLGFE